MKKSENLDIKFKIWFSRQSSRGVFGDGKWRLLKEIEKQGSLQKAASVLNISYRKAWGDLKKAENYLGIILTYRQRGGIKGGNTTLTDKGKILVKAYSRFRKQVNQTLLKSFETHLKNVLY